jgi:hypothetical protein
VYMYIDYVYIRRDTTPCLAGCEHAGTHSGANNFLHSTVLGQGGVPAVHVIVCADVTVEQQWRLHVASHSRD